MNLHIQISYMYISFTLSQSERRWTSNPSFFASFGFFNLVKRSFSFGKQVFCAWNAASLLAYQ